MSALAINITIPEPPRWTAPDGNEEFTLTTINLNLRLRPDGHLAASYAADQQRRRYLRLIPVPERPELAALVVEAARFRPQTATLRNLDDGPPTR